MREQTDILTLLDSSDPESIREGAQIAGKQRLAEAVPALVKHMSSSNIGVQEAVDRALRKIGGPQVVHAVIPMLRSDDAPVRNLSMDLLRALGSTDLEALHELLHDDDADVRIFAADILGSVGTILAVPPLCRALLHDPEVNVRYQAAVSLGALAFPEAAPSLNKALEDEEWVQFSVIEALTKIRDESSVGALFKALGQASDLVASSIVDALGEMGNIKAVPMLLKRLQSSPTPLCNKIVRAIVNIMGERSLTLLGAKDCENLRGYLATALKDEDPEIQDAVIKGLAGLGGEGATTGILALTAKLDVEADAERIVKAINSLAKLGNVPELESAIRGGNEMTMQIAMEVLLRVDDARAVALSAEIFWDRPRDIQRSLILEMANRAGKEYQDFFLDVLARNNDGTILRGALVFLGRKGDADAVFPRIVPLLSHPYDDVKEAALEACIALHTPVVEQHFKGMLKDFDPVKRMMGVYGLCFFDIAGNLDLLKDALNDKSPDVRKVAVESFGRECPIHEEYLPLVEEKLTDENREVRMAVFDTLGDCPNDRFTACLIMGLEDSDPWVKVRCAERLGDNKVAEAVEPLVRMLHDENHLIVLKAIEALSKIGGETAFRALLPVLEHRDRDLQAAAEEAVNEIHRQAGE